MPPPPADGQQPPQEAAPAAVDKEYENFSEFSKHVIKSCYYYIQSNGKKYRKNSQNLSNKIKVWKKFVREFKKPTLAIQNYIYPKTKGSKIQNQ